MDGPYFLESVDRVMKVLDVFSAETPELRLTDLSERLGMPKPQVMRIVTTLESGGYLVRDEETKRYRLGIRLFSLGMIVQHQMDLRRAAQPALQSLAAETQETVGLFVPDLVGTICVEVIDSPQSVRVFARPGRCMPWNAGSAAKVILAYLPEIERETILSANEFVRYTPRTIIDRDELRALLSTIEQNGYYVSRGDLDEGAGGVAAPIFDHSDRIVGAVSVSAPESRMTPDREHQLVELVRHACAATSAQMGHDYDERLLTAVVAGGS